MKTAVIMLVMALALIVPVGILVKVEPSAENQSQISTVETGGMSKKVQLPTVDDTLSDDRDIKIRPAEKIITLESSNMVVLRGPVTSQSVAKIQTELQKMSARLPKTAEIYLVLDTPGGSVFDGLDLIDFAQALPQKVNTITLFAASMGFQIAQNLDTRYITNQGTLMSHRAALDGFGGQLDGEFETRYKMIKRKVVYMDVVASERMGITLEQYQKLIKDEYWVHGFDSVPEKAADEVVNVRCGSSLTGEVEEKVQTFLGPVDVKFSQCPLIRGPLAVSFGNIAADKRDEVSKVIDTLLNDPNTYVKEFILTNKHYKYFKL